MHRSYQPILPSSSKYLQQKWDDKYYDEHRGLVKEAKPMVDTKAPRTYIHLHLNLKKLQKDEERLATIERDNRLFLEKVAYIMRTKGRVDNANSAETKSLSQERRQRELLRVTQENRDILRRLRDTRPQYRNEQLSKDWDQNLKYMEGIAAYAPVAQEKKGKKKDQKGSEKSSERGDQSARTERSDAASTDRSAKEEPKKQPKKQLKKEEQPEEQTEDKLEDKQEEKQEDAE